jgi:DNA-directed RNA polymerase specialized sigma24 family protein
MQNIFHPPQGGVVGVVIIPFNYEQLPEDGRKKVVPICIEAEDRDGNVIDPVWFEQGVAPICTELTDLAQSVLGDKRMVSDIVQPSVHKVWYKHRHNAGNKPYARIWRQAIWEARDQAAGGWRERRFRVVSRTLDELDREFPERTTDPRDYTLLYHQRIVLQTVEATLKQEGLAEMARVYELLKLGETWSEISTKLGQGEEALKRRFYRFRKKFRSNN